MRRFLRALLAFAITASLAFPSALAHAQQPAPPPPASDRDGDGLTDDYDKCPDTYSTTASGCPEEAPPPAVTPTEPPPPAVVEPPPTQPTGDEYEQLMRSLPKDFDINYSYTAADRKKKRENDPGRAAKSAKRLGIAGGSMLLVGLVALISTLSAGLVMSKQAKDTIEDEPDDPNMIDYAAREDALKKGETGDKVAIGGSAASGGVMGIGVALLLAARGVRKRQYGAPVRSGGGSMSDKTRKQLVIYGAVFGIYGIIGLGAGAALVGNDDEKKSRNGKILLGLGGTLAGIGLLMIIPVLINRARNKSARVTGGPMWVRGGGGGSIAVRF
jgi:hypothetical protein